MKRFLPVLLLSLVACAADSSDDESHADTSDALTSYDRQEVRDEVSAHAGSDLTNAHLTDQKLVNALGWLVDHDAPAFYISAIRSDHHNDGQAAHAGGHAADMYAKNGSDARRLIQLIAENPYVTEVGLGGAYKSYRSEVTGKKQYFNDNNATHVHIGTIHAFGR